MTNCASYKLITLCLLGWTIAGCEPLAEIPENLNFGVVTIALRENTQSEPTVTEDQATEELRAASDLWMRRCGIGLSHQAHFVIDAAERGVSVNIEGTREADRIQTQFYNPNYVTFVFVGDIFMDDDNEDDDTFTAGRSGFPWGAEKAIIISNQGLHSLVAAHEFGHSAGLLHTHQDEWDGESDGGDFRNLMYWISFESPQRELRSGQCGRARDYLLGHWRFAENCRPDSKVAGGSDYCPALQVPELPVPSSASPQKSASPTLLAPKPRIRNPDARPRCSHEFDTE